MADLAILGAGPAGIGAAHRVATAGVDVVVLEREDAVGGAARSITVGGVRCDLGSHRLHRAIEPSLLAVLEDLLGPDLQRRQRRGRIRLADRWVPFPLQPLATLRTLPPDFALRAALEALVPRTPAADTFDQVVRAGLGPTMADRFYGPYARKLWGLPPTEISGEQARRRVGASSPAAMVRRLVKGADPEARTFLYPRRGFGQLWEALADSAAAAGADIRLGTTVTRLDSTDRGVVITTDQGESITADHVWSTIPLPVLARLHPAPASVTAAAASLRTRAMVLVYLVLPLPQWTPFDAHYLPEGWTPITRISEPKNYRDGHPGRVPGDPDGGGDPGGRGDPGHASSSGDRGDPPDRTVLCAELPCAVGDAHWTASDQELADLVMAAIERAGLTCPWPIQVQTHRLPRAYPVYDLGHEAHLRVVDDWATSLPRILSFGRQGLFVHDNSHHALAMAWAAADAFRDGTFDAAAWAAARERFATHVVED